MSRPANGEARAGGVQSLHRALNLLEVVAGQGGHLTIGEIARWPDSPCPPPTG